MVDYAVFRAKAGDGRSKAADIVAAIRAGIRSGELKPGQRLAGSTPIGRAFNCSGKPVEAARNKLVQDGLLEHRDGSFFIAGQAEEPARTEVVNDEPLPPPGSNTVEVEKREPAVHKKAEDFTQQLNDAFAELLEDPPHGKQ